LTFRSFVKLNVYLWMYVRDLTFDPSFSVAFYAIYLSAIEIWRFWTDEAIDASSQKQTINLCD
jgi:hypothetical protein